MTGSVTRNNRTTSRWCWRARGNRTGAPVLRFKAERFSRETENRELTLKLGREGGVEPPSPGWSPGALPNAMLPPHVEAVHHAASRGHAGHGQQWVTKSTESVQNRTASKAARTIKNAAQKAGGAAQTTQMLAGPALIPEAVEPTIPR